MIHKKIGKCMIALLVGGSIACGIPSISVSAKEHEKPEVPVKAAESKETEQDRIIGIGSVSKMYVTTAVMQLVDRGEVDLDAPLVDYIPEFKMEDERYKEITVRMLMNHTSGLMGTSYGEGFLFDDRREDYHDACLKRLASQHLKYEPGAFNCYCNDGFTLLEILVERVSGMTYTEYLEKEICKPLSLENTGSTWNMDMDTQVPIYVNGNTRMANENIMLIGAGGILSDAKEVCTFGTAFFTGNDVLLSDRAKQEMSADNRAGDGVESFGLGWDSVEIADYRDAGVTVLSKGGDTFYQNADLVVAPEKKISVAVASSGGGSGVDEKVCLELLDIALAEQGITVEHKTEATPETLAEVPKEYLGFAGLYADARMTVEISFPDQQYMKITSVTSDREFEQQYMYTKDGSFVKMDGDVASGNAIPARPTEELSFKTIDGQIYVFEPSMGACLYKTAEQEVDEKVQKAWDQRSGVSYYLVSGPATDENYAISNNSITLYTSDLAKGYVNGCVMQDETHAGYDRIIPGTASRDMSNLRIETVKGKEYLCLDELNFRYISEEAIPTLTDDLAKVDLKTGEASWFKIDGAKDTTLRLDIPKGAAVYVYDQYGNMRYSSFMQGYGTGVPLPEYGMIVFIGEDGLTVNIGR